MSSLCTSSCLAQLGSLWQTFKNVLSRSDGRLQRVGCWLPSDRTFELIDSSSHYRQFRELRHEGCKSWADPRVYMRNLLAVSKQSESPSVMMSDFHCCRQDHFDPAHLLLELTDLKTRIRVSLATGASASGFLCDLLLHSPFPTCVFRQLACSIFEIVCAYMCALHTSDRLGS